jgi:hypothetical protein
MKNVHRDLIAQGKEERPAKYRFPIFFKIVEMAIFYINYYVIRGSQ